MLFVEWKGGSEQDMMHIGLSSPRTKLSILSSHPIEMVGLLFHWETLHKSFVF